MKARLDDLPGSKDEFWEGADIHTEIMPKRVHFFDQPHIFERISGHQARCLHCDWGFQLDPGDHIVNGHLYDKTGRKVL